MKLAYVTTTPEVQTPFPVSLFSGTFPERLEKGARSGYDGVELMTVRPAELDGAALASQVANQGLEIAAIASGALGMVEGLTLLSAKGDTMRRAQERLHQLVALAAVSKAPLVTIGGFRGWLEWTGPGARDRLTDILAEAAAYGADQGVRLVLEPLNRYETDIVRNTAEALAFLDEIGADNVGLLLDTFHANIEEASTTGCFCAAAAANRLWHVHLGDSNRLPPGQGHIDFGDIIATLQKIEYQDYLSAELLSQPDPDAAGKATARHMRSLLGSM